MSCVSRGCGFISLGFLGLGGLIVSRGLGSCTDEVIEFEQPNTGLQEGYGRATRIVPTPRDAPKAAIRFTGKNRKKGC